MKLLGGTKDAAEASVRFGVINCYYNKRLFYRFIENIFVKRLGIMMYKKDETRFFSCHHCCVHKCLSCLVSSLMDILCEFSFSSWAFEDTENKLTYCQRSHQFTFRG